MSRGQVCQGRAPVCSRDLVEKFTVAAMSPYYSLPCLTPPTSVQLLEFPQTHSHLKLSRRVFLGNFPSTGTLTTEALRHASVPCSKSTLCIYLGSGCHEWQSGIMHKVICLMFFSLGDCQSCEERAACPSPLLTTSYPASLPFSC